MLLTRRKLLAGAAASVLAGRGQEADAWTHGTQGAPAPTFLSNLAGPAAGTLNLLPWGANAKFTDFTNPAFTKTRSSISATNIAAPDSTNTGQHLSEDSSNSTHFVLPTDIPKISNTLFAQPMRVAVIAKAAERTRIVVEWLPGADSINGAVSIGFDLAGGQTNYDNVVGSNQSLLATPLITNLGGGWWLCQFDLQCTLNSQGTGYIFEPKIYLDNGAGTAARSISYAGNGTSGVDLWWFNVMPLQAWSITNLVFYDDFTTLATIDTANTKAPGFKWYVNNLFPNSAYPSFQWQTNPPSAPTDPSYLTLSSPSVLKIYNPNTLKTGLTSQIWSVVTDGANGYVGSAFQAPLMYDGSFSFDNAVVSPDWNAVPAFWGVATEALTNNGLNPTFQYNEWDVFESGTGSLSLTVHNNAQPQAPIDFRVASAGVGGLMVFPVFHRITSLWINAAANNGWGSYWSFFDGTFAPFGNGQYNAAAELQPQINNTSPGLGANGDGYHNTIFLDTGENTTSNPHGGWPFYIDWVKVYGYVTPPIVYAHWNYFDQPTTGLNPTVGALVTSNNGWTVTKTAADAVWDMIRSHIGRGAGKWYWEITISGTVASATSLMLGLVNQAASVASGAFPGSSSAGAGARHGSNWNSFVSGVTGVVATAVTFAASDVFGFAFDADLGKVYIHRNGTWINGTPASGNAVWTGLTTVSPGVAAAGWYPALGIHDTTCTAVANFGTSAFAFSVPSGYNSGLF